MNKPGEGPSVTPAGIERLIKREHYAIASDAFPEHKGFPHSPSMDTLTICVLELENGFTVVGKSSCVSPENFDATIGQRVARKNAVEQVWGFAGYLLREQMHQERQHAAAMSRSVP